MTLAIQLLATWLLLCDSMPYNSLLYDSCHDSLPYDSCYLSPVPDDSCYVTPCHMTPAIWVLAIWLLLCDSLPGFCCSATRPWFLLRSRDIFLGWLKQSLCLLVLLILGLVLFQIMIITYADSCFFPPCESKGVQKRTIISLAEMYNVHTNIGSKKAEELCSW